MAQPIDLHPTLEHAITCSIVPMEVNQSPFRSICNRFDVDG
ncbi:MAG: hypothetical protein ABW098_07075 [Candidatus Thiodiazotropha sp.]